MISSMKYKCPATSCKFMTLDTCSNRISKAANKAPISSDMPVPLGPCEACIGPVKISSGRRVKIDPVAQKERSYSSPKEKKERAWAGRKRFDFMHRLEESTAATEAGHA